MIMNSIFKQDNKINEENNDSPNLLKTLTEKVFTNDEDFKGPDIVIPYGYTKISSFVFSNKENIFSIKLPDGITVLRSHAFNNCKQLRRINIPNSVLVIDDSVFKGCKSLKSIVIPENVKKIYSNTFYGCDSLEEIILPKGLTEIVYQAFAYCCNLKEITIPVGVNRIDSDAFTGCVSLQNIFVDDENTTFTDIDGVLYNKSLTKLIKYPDGRTQSNFTVPVSVIEIDHKAFSGCRYVTSICFPSCKSNRKIKSKIS